MPKAKKNPELINDTIVKVGHDYKVGFEFVFEIDEHSYLRQGVVKRRVRYEEERINAFRNWFWYRINQESRAVGAIIDQMVEAWTVKKKLFIRCDDPSKQCFVDVIVEYLSWIIWRRGLAPGMNFTTKAAQAFA